jgi:NADPH:quinone reductase-like Zn-dependent oxidoreductase
MKAIVCTKYGPPEVLQIKEVEKPAPKDNEVLVKIHATTVTVADFRIRSFTIPPSFWIPARLMLGITKPRQPILGVELAGEIEAIGKNVKRFKKGDQIFATTLKEGMGAYAEYKCLQEAGSIAIKPFNVSYEEAAAIPVGAITALHYLKLGKITRGQKILIYGASGSVGTYAVQLAKHFGAEVTGVCSHANIALVKSLGTDKVIDYTAPDFITQLEMYDAVFVAIDKIAFSICNSILKENGVYLNITAPIKNMKMLWTSLTTNKKIFVGENANEKAEDLLFLKKLVETDELKVVVDKKYTIDEIADAHRYVGEGHKKGNVVVSI